jgi:hypothetical protein
LAVAVLCGFAAQRNVTPVVALLMGGVVSAIPARQLQNRWDLIRYGALGGVAQALTILGILMLEPVRSMEGGTLGLALMYVLGMSVTYSALGVVAALTGALFGSAMQNPIVVAIIVVVMLALAASMFGLWELRVPGWAMRAAGGERQPQQLQLAVPGRVGCQVHQARPLVVPHRQRRHARAHRHTIGAIAHELGKLSLKGLVLGAVGDRRVVGFSRRQGGLATLPTCRPCAYTGGRRIRPRSRFGLEFAHAILRAAVLVPTRLGRHGRDR